MGTVKPCRTGRTPSAGCLAAPATRPQAATVPLTSIWCSRTEALPRYTHRTAATTTVPSAGSGLRGSWVTRSVPSAASPAPSSTTSARIVATGICSGTRPTGRPCASHATTGRPSGRSEADRAGCVSPRMPRPALYSPATLPQPSAPYLAPSCLPPAHSGQESRWRKPLGLARSEPQRYISPQEARS